MPALDLRPEALVAWQDRTDELADAAAEGLRPARPVELLAAVEARAAAGHAGARALLEATADLPPWADRAALERGRRLVVELGSELALVLIAGALLDGYASPSLSTPLLRTGRLRGDAARRLYETGQVVHNARAPGALGPGGLGRRTVLAVRLLHAAVRGHLRAVGYVGPDGGQPIHLLDMAHTATAFSHKGPSRLPVLGVSLTGGELDDLHHFWRVVNHLHGVPEPLLPEDRAGAAALSAALDAWRFDPTFDGGKQLAHAALDGLAGQPPFFLPRPALEALTARCLGPDRAAAWGLQVRPAWGAALDGLAGAGRVLTPAWRALPLARPLRARLAVGLMGRSLQRGLGADPAGRAFGPIAGEEAPWGPGLEPRAA